MEARHAQLIQDGFKTFSEAHDIESSMGYFVDRDGTTLLAFNEITDQHVMHLLATMVLKMAEKHEADPKAILGALSEVVEDYTQK